MGSQIYEKPVHELMRDMVTDIGLKKGEIIYKSRILNWFSKKYPKLKKSTIDADLTRVTINAPSRVHYNAKPADDLLFQIDSSNYRLYDPETDPEPIYEKQQEAKRVSHEISESPLTNEILKITKKYLQQWDETQAGYKQRIEELEQENLKLHSETNKVRMRIADLEVEYLKLRSETNQERTILDEINDETLKNRIQRLGSPPLDTLIREAGVILEDRLHTIGKVDSSQFGTGLVDEVLNNKTGTLIFSTHDGEQEGVRMLYRGAIQFIRNPPMHRLIEFSENNAKVFLRLIDSLLQLLTEFQPRSRGEVTLEDIRRMLNRSPINENQRKLYSFLYHAGERGINSDELAGEMGITNSQLAGVLGSLGRRINQTEGLEAKGGIILVFEIKEISNGKAWYRMLPILRKALEKGGLV
jgi:hypothetical protein